MGWKDYFDQFAKNWPPFSTTGEISVHGVIVDHQGSRQNPLSEEAFLRAIQGHSQQSEDYVPAKTFYEDVSDGQLRVGRVTVERFTMSGRPVDQRTVYEAFFRHIRDNRLSFDPRTHFMFALDKRGASGVHRHYALWFDASMPNPSTIIHEFGHNLGLMHATTPDDDRGDKSDRMGAKSGFMEFNAPNRIYLRWLRDEAAQLVQSSGDYKLTPLEYSNVSNIAPKVIKIPISDSNCLYLSLRDRIGPYDSRFLSEEYVRRMSIHTRTLDKGRPKKSCLLAILGESQSYRFDNSTLLRTCKEIEVSNLQHEGDEIRFHVGIRTA